MVRSSGTDFTLDDILTILDEHNNNVKALAVMHGQKGDSIRLGGVLIEAPADPSSFISGMLPPRPCSQIEV